MLDTNSGQSACQVHLALKSALRKMAKAEECAVICLGEIMARKLYRELGYSSINHYAEAELGFSARRTRDFVALSRKLAGLPRLKKEVESGNLGYTVAPVRISLEMTPTQFARYESLWEQIRKHGGVPADQVETLLAVMQSFTEANRPRGPEKSGRPAARSSPYPPV